MTLKTFEGNYQGKGLKIGLVASRFNYFITQKLIEGAEDALARHGVNLENVGLYLVPGALEVPLLVKNILNNYDAVIALGTIIRGSTPHFDYVASESAKGLAQLALESGKPVINCLLTTDNLEQAIERAGTKSGNKGFDAIQSAIEMANLLKEIK
jgi:6,7-dimethyl-8-ribityllumazine synthase